MRVRRVLWIILLGLAAAVLVSGLAVASVWLYLHPRYERVVGVVYGQRHGHNLAMDVVRPAKTNGFAVVLLVSGGWKSLTPGCGTKAGLPGETCGPPQRKARLAEHDLGPPAIRRLV